MISTLASPISVALAWAEVQETTAPAEEVASADTGVTGQVIVGTVVSVTTTLNVQVDTLLLSSVAVAVTAVVPIAKGEPEAAL